MAPMFSVLLDSTVSPSRTMEIGRQTAEAGIGRIWASEDYFSRAGFGTAGALLAAHPRLEVGLGVVSLLVRHPSALAMEIASLELMFPGRLLAGVGLGFLPMLKKIGIQPEKSVGAVRDGLEITRRLCAGETVSWSDDLFQLEDVHLDHPAGEQRTQFWVAGSSRQMLRVGARHSDGLVLSVMSSPGYIAWVNEQIADIVADRATPLPIAAFQYVACDADAERAYDRARSHMARELVRRPITSVMLQRSRVLPQIQDLLAGDPATLYDRLTPEIVDEFVPSGTPEMVRAKILAAADPSVTDYSLLPLADGTGTEYTQLIGGLNWS